MKTHYDLIVVGGGLTGVCASIAAARQGVDDLDFLVLSSVYLDGCSVNILKLFFFSVSFKKNLN